MERLLLKNTSVRDGICVTTFSDTGVVIVFIVGDIWPQYEREDGAEEPDWVKTERQHFSKHRDKDNDGSLDKEEISNWISPPDYDHAHAEAKHLVYEADTNKVSPNPCYGKSSLLSFIHHRIKY